MGERRADDEIGRIDSVGVDVYFRPIHNIRHRAPLDAGKVKIGFVVDAPHLVGDQRAVLA